MITSRLTAIMVAMSLLGAGAPIAAMAQATADNDALQAIGVETGNNTQSNTAVVAQEAENEIEISSEADSEAESEADSEAEGGESSSEADSEAESEAEATTAVANSTIVANNAQSATTNQLNLLEDNDDVTVNATQAALQAAIAADVDIGNATATEIGDLLELFGLDVDGPVLP
jgi:hypothetical protein